MSIAEAAYTLAKWKNNPVTFFQDVTGLMPSSDQQNLLHQVKYLENRRFLICSARSTGKTLILAVIALWSAVVLPFFTKMPYKVSILSGSFEQSRVLYEYSRSFLTAHPLIADQLMGEPTKREIKFKSGSWILALPASERTVLSKHCDLLIIDEAAEKHLLDGKLIKSALPLVSASKFPRVILSSTPYQYMSYFVDMWLDESNIFTDYKRQSWAASSCPWISRYEYAEAQRTLDTETFQINWEGKAVPVLGTLFNLGDLRACRIDTEDPPAVGEGPIEWGIDWGFEAPTVLHICQLEGEDWTILHVKEWTRQRFETIHTDLESYRSKFPPVSVNVDSSHIGENQRLKEAGFPVKEVKFKAEKEVMKANLRMLLEKKKLHIWRNFVNTLSQLSKYTQDTKRNDDFVDSLMLAVKRSSRPSQGTWIAVKGRVRARASPFGYGRTNLQIPRRSPILRRRAL